jgi:hypothetical protein
MHEHMAGWISPRSSLCVALLLAIQVGFLLLPFFFVLLARIGFFFLVLDITSLCSSEILVIIFLVPMFLFLVSFFYMLTAWWKMHAGIVISQFLCQVRGSRWMDMVIFFLFVVHCLEAYGVSAPGLKFLQHKHVLALIALIFCNLLVIFLPRFGRT